MPSQCSQSSFLPKNGVNPKSQSPSYHTNVGTLLSKLQCLQTQHDLCSMASLCNRSRVSACRFFSSSVGKNVSLKDINISVHHNLDYRTILRMAARSIHATSPSLLLLKYTSVGSISPLSNSSHSIQKHISSSKAFVM